MDNDPVVGDSQYSDSDEDSIPGLYSRDNYNKNKFIFNDDTLSVNEFQSDFTVIIKDLTRDECHFNFSAFMSVNLVKDNYNRAHGLEVARQRLLFNSKVTSDEDTLHSHGVLDGSIMHLVRHLRGGGGRIKKTKPLGNVHSPPPPLQQTHVQSLPVQLYTTHFGAP